MLTEDAVHGHETFCSLFDQFVFNPVCLLQICQALLKLSDETFETLQVSLRKGSDSSHECHNAPEFFTLSETKWDVFSSLKKPYHRGYVVDCSFTHSIYIHILPSSSAGFSIGNDGLIVLISKAVVGAALRVVGLFKVRHAGTGADL